MLHRVHQLVLYIVFLPFGAGQAAYNRFSELVPKLLMRTVEGESKQESFWSVKPLKALKCLLELRKGERSVVIPFGFIPTTPFAYK